MMRRGLLVTALGSLVACGGDPVAEAPEQPVPAATAGMAAVVDTAMDQPASRVGDRQSERPAAAPESSPFDRGGLLERVPADAWFALRLPSAAALRQAAVQSAFAQALNSLALSDGVDVTGEIDTLLDLEFDTTAAGGGVVRMRDLLEELNGELVIALAELRPLELMMSPSGLPGTVVVHAELADESTSWERLLSAMAHGSKAAPLLRDVDAGCRMTQDDLFLELSVHDHVFTAAISSSEARVSAQSVDARAVGRSMLQSQVVAAAPPPEGEPMFEAFVNLEPAWQLAAMSMGSDAELLKSTGLDEVSGLSWVAGFDGQLVAETFTLHSPGLKDPISRIFRQKAPDPEWAGWASSESDAGSLVSLDLTRLYDQFVELIPGEARPEFDQQIALVRDMTGLDVRRDILRSFGTHFLVASRGRPEALVEDGDYDGYLVVEVRDPLKVTRLLRMLVETSGAKTRAVTVRGQLFTSLDVSALAATMPGQRAPEITWTIGDDYLLIGTSMATVGKALDARQRDAGAVATALAEAVEPGVTCVSFQSGASQLLQLLSSMGTPEARAAMRSVEGSEVPDTIGSVVTSQRGVHFRSVSAAGSLVSAAMEVAASLE